VQRLPDNESSSDRRVTDLAEPVMQLPRGKSQLAAEMKQFQTGTVADVSSAHGFLHLRL
jgi:hypothetical protein